MTKFEKEKVYAAATVSMYAVFCLATTILAWMGIFPFCESVIWLAIPDWYYAGTVCLMLITWAVGIFWIGSQEDY
jgi:hypothetical protein